MSLLKAILKVLPFFLILSWLSKTLARGHLQYDLASVSVTRMSRMQLVPLVQKPRINRSPHSSSGQLFLSCWFLLAGVLGGISFHSVNDMIGLGVCLLLMG
jgi:hypothetical protein